MGGHCSLIAAQCEEGSITLPQGNKMKTNLGKENPTKDRKRTIRIK